MCRNRYCNALGSQETKAGGSASSRSQALRSAAMATRGQPRLVDVVLAGGEPGQAGVFGDPDPVFDPGVCPVAGFEEPDLPEGGVGDEGLVAPPVPVLEQGQLRAEVGVFAPDDDPDPRRPPGQGEQVGDLHDLGVVADLAVGSNRRRTRRLRNQADRRAHRIPSHSLARGRAKTCLWGGLVGEVPSWLMTTASTMAGPPVTWSLPTGASPIRWPR